MTDFDRAYRENAELVYRYVFSLTGMRIWRRR